MEILELVHQETSRSFERPFECSFNNCRKTFGNKRRHLHRMCFLPFVIGRRSDLVRHARIHTNERLVFSRHVK